MSFKKYKTDNPSLTSSESSLRNKAIIFLGFCVLLTIGIALRLLYLQQNLYLIDSDEAIVGLMGKHITEGSHWPHFYYGQSYMGSLEAIVASLFFKFFGLSSISLKWAMLFLYAIYVITLYPLARIFLSSRASLIVIAFAVFSPFSFFEWSIKARGGYIEMLILGNIALTATLRLLLEKSKSRLFDFFSIGFSLGVAWWINFQTIYFIIPIFVFVAINTFFRNGVVGSIVGFVFSLISFLIGSSIFWDYNLREKTYFKSFYDQIALLGGGGDLFEKFTDNFFSFLDISFPMILGAKRFWDNEIIFNSATIIAYALLSTVILAVLIYSILKEKNKISLLFFFAFTVVVVFCFSANKSIIVAPRYLLALYSTLFVLYGVGVFAVYNIPFIGKLLSPILFCSLIILNLLSLFDLKSDQKLFYEPLLHQISGDDRVSIDQKPLYKWLGERGIDFIRTDYWIGYRTAFETSEKIKFSPIGDPISIRIEDYEKYNPKSLKATYVISNDEGPVVKRILDLMNYSYDEHEVAGYLVLSNLKNSYPKGEQFTKDEYSISASHGTLPISNMTDDNLETRWGSGTPQKSGMNVQIQFRRPSSVSQVSFKYGKWIHDAPKDLIFWGTDSKNNKKILFETHEMPDYYIPNEEFIFSLGAEDLVSLTIEIDSNHPVFDWSIAEIDFYKKVKEKQISEASE